MRLVTSNSRAIQKNLETLSGYNIFVKFEARASKETAIYQTRSNAVIFDDTLLAEFIEKAICMKNKDQLCERERVILRTRFVLKVDSQSGSQNLFVQEVRSSRESQ